MEFHPIFDVFCFHLLIITNRSQYTLEGCLRPAPPTSRKRACGRCGTCCKTSVCLLADRSPLSANNATSFYRAYNSLASTAKAILHDGYGRYSGSQKCYWLNFYSILSCQGASSSAGNRVPHLSRGVIIVEPKLNLEGQGRQPPPSQPPAVTDQPQPPAASRLHT